MTAEERARRDVAAWSRRMGNPPDRHAWLMAALEAELAGTELPPAGPGTAYYRRSTAEARLETLRRIVAQARSEAAQDVDNVDAEPVTVLTTPMASDIARAASKAREWTLKRDELIREAYAAGKSLRAIAGEAGMTHAGVASVVKRGPK